MPPARPPAAKRPARAAPPAPAAGAPAPALLVRRNLPLLLQQARESVIVHFRPILQAHGLTEQQWRILRALADAGPHSALEPREIVARCGISSPSLAGVLARMDELGLVQRARMPGDARRVQVQLSPRSRALVAAMAPQIEATYAAIEQRVGAGLIGQCHALLDALVAQLGAVPPLAAVAPRGEAAMPAAQPARSRRSTKSSRSWPQKISPSIT